MAFFFLISRVPVVVVAFQSQPLKMIDATWDQRGAAYRLMLLSYGKSLVLSNVIFDE